MWTRIMADLDQASWRFGRPREPGQPREETWRCLGDFERGPWIYIIEREANRVVPAHSHDQDEVVYILEGGLTHREHWCGPGTVLSFPRRMQYGFTVGPDGVKWLMMRTGPSEGETADDWQDHQGRTFDEYREARAARGSGAESGAA